MKPLRWALGLALGLGALLLGGSLLLPATTQVERSVVIDRPQTEVFAALDSFRRFPQWSPWAEQDPETGFGFSGPARGVGATMTWSGNQAVGSGQQIIRRSEAPHLIVVEQAFGDHVSTSRYALAAEDGGTRVSWRIEMAHGFNPLSRWMGLLSASGMASDIERGLARLKLLLEAPPQD